MGKPKKPSGKDDAHQAGNEDAMHEAPFWADWFTQQNTVLVINDQSGPIHCGTGNQYNNYGHDSRGR